MGILRRLFPWYSWDAQWSHHVFSLPDGDLGMSVEYTLPPGFRLQLLTIDFNLNTGVGFQKRFPDLEIWRGSNRFFHTTSANSIAANTNADVTFMQNLARSSLASAAAHVLANLSTAAYMLPGDRIVIGVEAIDPLDRITLLTISAKRWIEN